MSGFDLSGMDRVRERLRAIQGRLEPDSPEMTAFRADVVRIAEEDHDRLLLQGRDAPDGEPTAPLQPATIGRGRPGDGPARVPRGRGSRMIAGRVIEWVREAGGALALALSYPGVPFARYLRRGTPTMEARPTGISGEGRRRIGRRLEDLGREVLGP